METAILNSLGEPLKEVIYHNVEGKRVPLLLNKQEQIVANVLQQQYNALRNALGYEISITTLTTILKSISEQKFYHVAPAEYLPVKVGEGAWSSNLVKYRSFNLADDFSTGVINTGGNSSRLAVGDAGVDSVNIPVLNWGKEIGWSIFDLELAAKSGNWDLVSAKEKSRKENWDLGIQKIAFLGLSADTTNVPGLLNLGSAITNNTTLITAPIYSLAASPNNLSSFIAQVLNVYRVNVNRTAWPTHFIMPESDYLGLATPSSPTYPIKSILELMLETFKTMTGNSNFKILPLAYGDSAYNSLGVQRYVLLNYNEDSIVMNIPVDYTNTLANSINNFQFQNVGYGQFTGVLAARPAETMYFSY